METKWFYNKHSVNGEKKCSKREILDKINEKPIGR